MPRLIDYASRFDLIREAVLAVVLRDGAAAVCVPSVSAELGISPATLRRTVRSAEDLPLLGVQWICRRRRHRTHFWPGLRHKDSTLLHRITRALELHVPLQDDVLEDCRAWAALTSVSSDPRVHRLATAYADELDALMLGCVTRLQVPEPDQEVEALRLGAVVAGLTHLLCTERTTREEAKRVLDLHLGMLAAPGLEHVASG